jgi:hypothetical protein
LQYSNSQRKEIISKNSTKSEYIFILDRSGSMKIDPMNTLIQAMLLVIEDLPESAFLNIYSFGTTFEILFKDSSQNPIL